MFVVVLVQFDGTFSLYGPFTSEKDASEWADKMRSGLSFPVVTAIQQPN